MEINNLNQLILGDNLKILKTDGMMNNVSFNYEQYIQLKVNGGAGKVNNKYRFNKFAIFVIMNQKTKYIARLIKLNIAEIDPNAQVILYGSRARGDARSDSDWDILILTDYSVDNNTEKIFRDHLYYLELQTGEPFSVFVYSKQDWNTKQRITPYYENVTRQGIQL